MQVTPKKLRAGSKEAQDVWICVKPPLTLLLLQLRQSSTVMKLSSSILLILGQYLLLYEPFLIKEIEFFVLLVNEENFIKIILLKEVAISLQKQREEFQPHGNPLSQKKT